MNSTLNLILFAAIQYPERSGAELQSGLGRSVRTGVQNSFKRKIFSVGVKRSALPLCYTGMETEFESAEVMRSE
ncbi:MAG: hypothetical protein M3P92_07780, partial [Actinomycetota bacterium]|nr:hypothetical protein [Actinomycetota bacterium]